MADDMTRNYSIANAEDQMQVVLYEVELLLRTGAIPKSLSDFGLPMPMPNFIERLRNRLLMEEKNYDREQLALENETCRARLNSQQLHIYEDIITSVTSNKHVLGFVYGHGGTGKTFLWTTIISALRSRGNIVLAVASSGIASLLLPSGRTAHSRFKIPLDLSDESLCLIKKKTHLAQLIIEASLIIWDEAPMNDRSCFESLDKSLQDLFNNPNIPFGGKSVLLGGDFRQTLPIVPKASKALILASTLPNSHLWKHFKIYQLSQNMRLERPNLSLSERNSIAEFSSWLLALGDGKLGTPEINDLENTKNIEIPTQYLIPFKDGALNELIQFIYDADTLQNPSASSFSRKATVCPKNETAQEINLAILQMCHGSSITYNSVDSALPHMGDRGDTEMLYPTEYLNLLDFNGLPLHCLQLKVNAPVILLRNLNPAAGLCNGTRLIVTQLLPRIIEA
ncbi:ATP-dependent DNA helicase pif1-like [Helianthus annuus]|uniref:ATP-dependent DNA helicase pif1-like n=1 Tax=Helianthus annuus TaxID=4232 RepID=UPI000B90561A|nr:ATP-dependent DNA helicase pif1-like [Helianthus annuus]